jgi:predicted amidohydrolase YtcJ
MAKHYYHEEHEGHEDLERKGFAFLHALHVLHGESDLSSGLSRLGIGALDSYGSIDEGKRRMTVTDKLTGRNPGPRADMVLENGTIYTVNPTMPWARALAVANGAIVYVGDEKGAAGYVDSRTEVIDLDGKMVLPGFIDSHAHVSGTLTPDTDLPLHDIDSVEGILDAVHQRAAQTPPGEVLYGSGWANELFPPEGPSKELLDGIVSDRPVLLTSTDGHALWVNSRAIQIAGVTADTTCPDSGCIEKDPRTGAPNGTFRETARDLIQNHMPGFSVDQIKRGIQAFMAEAARVGVTTVHDPLLLLPDSNGQLNGFGAFCNNIPAFEALAAEKKLTLRVRGTIMADPTKGVAQIADYINAAAAQKDPLFQITGAKIFVDGVIEGGTGYLLEPYAHKPGFRGHPLWDSQGLNEFCREADRADLQIHLHAIGDAAIEMSLDALAHARQANSRRRGRHLITHLQVVADKDIPRMAALDVIGVPQPFWHCKEPGIWEQTVQYLGSQRAEKQYPMKRLADAGVLLASASDYPVQVPSPPLLGIMLGASRCSPGQNTPGSILGPEDRLPLADMIASFTRNGAYANFMENDVGTIEVGKKADLVVLPHNLFDLPLEDVAETPVLMTIFNGRKVFQKDVED